MPNGHLDMVSLVSINSYDLCVCVPVPMSHLLPCLGSCFQFSRRFVASSTGDKAAAQSDAMEVIRPSLSSRYTGICQGGTAGSSGELCHNVVNIHKIGKLLRSIFTNVIFQLRKNNNQLLKVNVVTFSDRISK